MTLTRELVIDERGHYKAYEPAVVEHLLAIGAMWMEHGTIRCHSSLDLRDYPELGHCDFCHTQPVTWEIDAVDFPLPNGLTSVGAWCACEDCGRCIVEGRAGDLNTRSLNFIRRERPAPGNGEYIRAQLALLRGFWKHYRSIQRLRPGRRARRETS